MQTTWFERGLVRDRGRAVPLRGPSPLLLALVVQWAVLSYGLGTFRKISSTAALNGCSKIVSLGFINAPILRVIIV